MKECRMFAYEERTEEIDLGGRVHMRGQMLADSGRVIRCMVLNNHVTRNSFGKKCLQVKRYPLAYSE